MSETTEIAKAGCWTFDPARQVWWAKSGENTWTEVKGTLDQPPPTYEVTVDGLTVAEFPSGWHATEFACHGLTARQARKVVTIKRSDGAIPFA